MFKLLEASFELIVPLVVASIIDVGIGNGDKDYILKMCGVMVLLGVVGLASSITAQYFAAKAATGFATKLRHALFAHIQSLSFSEIDRIGTSTMITRMTSDINQLQSGVNMVLRLFLRSPFIVFGAMIMAFTAGMLAGLITGLLHTLMGIPAILAGILTQLGLWTVNMIIMGLQQGKLISTLTIPARNSNLMVSAMYLSKALNGSKPIIFYPPLLLGIVTVIIIGVLYWFFGTELGSSIRATGANANMARAQGINTDAKKLIGLMLSNGLVALSGALLAQYQGFADINMGRGAIVIGLASVIIGEVIFGKIFKNFGLKLLAVSFGAVIYYIVIQAVISLMDIDTDYMKLISATIVAVFLAVPNLRGQVFGGLLKKKKEAEHA